MTKSRTNSTGETNHSNNSQTQMTACMQFCTRSKKFVLQI